MVFNYLGQFDRVLAESRLFRFASESTGPWHSPQQVRRYPLEVNSLVMNDQMEFWWTYNPSLQPEAKIQKLSEEFLFALRELIVHCESPDAGGRTPSDFPLVRLNQTTVDRLVAEQRDVEDICPLISNSNIVLFGGFSRPAVGVRSVALHLARRSRYSGFPAGLGRNRQRDTILRTTITVKD